MEDYWHAGVRPGMAIRETDSELGLRPGPDSEGWTFHAIRPR